MLVTSSFKPAPLLANRHLQTLWRSLFRRRFRLPDCHRQLIELADGDFIELQSFGKQQQPHVMLLHGLEGSVRSPYIQELIISLTVAGFYVTVMHFRGCGSQDNRLARSYHSGVSDDLQQVVAQLSERKIPVHHLVGFSLGGNVLLKWLGEQGDNAPVQSAVAVSVPLCLDVCADTINVGFSRLYQWHLLRTLKRKARLKKHRFPQAIAISESAINSLRSFWEFDEAITAPLNGFTSARDYYQKVSARQFLKAIKIRTLLLQAKDDPFMTPEVLPGAEELSEHLVLEISDKGGHVGFVQSYWGQGYITERVLQFLDH